MILKIFMTSQMLNLHAFKIFFSKILHFQENSAITTTIKNDLTMRYACRTNYGLYVGGMCMPMDDILGHMRSLTKTFK